MNFAKQKQKYLANITSGKDKSKKGCIDNEIRELVDVINRDPHYYTTSSCSGRIMLYSASPSRKKNETQWIFVSHTVVSEEEVRKNLTALPSGQVFFRFEPLILHVVCRDSTAADHLLRICNAAGLKHSGIISLQNRIIVEIVGNDRLDALIAHDGRLLITVEGISYYIADANEKMGRNAKRIERLTTYIKGFMPRY